ncbi:hypothetical protein [Vibrio phage vB_VhaP_PG11]|nr:hypothetical protein [Vibrio phage vB_VhaP_PG11]
MLPRWAKGTIFSFFKEMEKGQRAVITQSYTEANVKNGVQFQYASYVDALAASGIVDYVITTGNKPLAMKGRSISFDGNGVKADVYVAPTYSGGSVDPVYGMNAINQEATTVQILTGATVTAPGTQGMPGRHYLGSDPGGARTAVITSGEVFGLETILAPNTTYLLRFTSLDTTDTQRLSLYFTWYEGGLDMPYTGE